MPSGQAIVVLPHVTSIQPAGGAGLLITVTRPINLVTVPDSGADICPFPELGDIGAAAPLSPAAAPEPTSATVVRTTNDTHSLDEIFIWLSQRSVPPFWPLPQAEGAPVETTLFTGKEQLKV